MRISPVKVNFEDPKAIPLLSHGLRRFIHPVSTERELVVFCVGTDRSTGDSLGPLVGSRLTKNGPCPIHIYGTLDQPVHAMNLQETLQEVRQRFPSPYIIAVDACLGQLSNVGMVQLKDGPVRPGAGVNKDLPPIGDMHINGIVNVGGFMEYFVLQNTRLSLVMRMADKIADAIHAAVLSIDRTAAAARAPIF